MGTPRLTLLVRQPCGGTARQRRRAISCFPSSPNAQDMFGARRLKWRLALAQLDDVDLRAPTLARHRQLLVLAKLINDLARSGGRHAYALCNLARVGVWVAAHERHDRIRVCLTPSARAH